MDSATYCSVRSNGISHCVFSFESALRRSECFMKVRELSYWRMWCGWRLARTFATGVVSFPDMDGLTAHYLRGVTQLWKRCDQVRESRRNERKTKSKKRKKEKNPKNILTVTSSLPSAAATLPQQMAFVGQPCARNCANMTGNISAPQEFRHSTFSSESTKASAENTRN